MPAVIALDLFFYLVTHSLEMWGPVHPNIVIFVQAHNIQIHFVIMEKGIIFMRIEITQYIYIYIYILREREGEKGRQ